MLLSYLFFSMPLTSLAGQPSKSLAARHFSQARNNKVALNFDVLEMVGHRQDARHISNFSGSEERNLLSCQAGLDIDRMLL